MNRRSIVVLGLAVASVFATEAVYAVPPAVRVPVHAMFSSTKTVKVSIRNDSGATITLKAGEDLITLEPGKKKELHLAVGTRIMTESATSAHAAGTLVAEVAKDLEGATIGLK